MTGDVSVRPSEALCQNMYWLDHITYILDNNVRDHGLCERQMPTLAYSGVGEFFRQFLHAGLPHRCSPNLRNPRITYGDYCETGNGL